MTDLRKPLKRPSICCGDTSCKVPRPDRALDRLEQRVLADALLAAEHERVVDLLLRPLHPVGQPFDDVVGVVRIDVADVVEPRAGLVGVARLDASAAGTG